MYLRPLHLYLQASFPSFSFSLPECRQLRGLSPQTAVSGRRQTIEFWKWHGMRQRDHEVVSSLCLPPHQGSTGRLPTLS